MTGTQVTRRPIIRVPKPIYDRLTALKMAAAERTGREVTYAEVIEQLLERQP